MTQETRRAPWWHGKGEPLTPEQARRLRADLRPRVVIAGAYVLLMVIAVVAAGLLAEHQHPERPVRWPLLIGIAAGLVVVLAAGLALGLWLRVRHQPTRRYVLSGDRRARVRVSKQLRKGQPVDDQDREVARATVEITRRQWWLPLYFGVMGVVFAGVALLDHTGHADRPAVVQAMRVLFPLMMLTFAVLVRRQQRRVLANAARLGLDGDPAPTRSERHCP